jgi:glutathione S-transferase
MDAGPAQFSAVAAWVKRCRSRRAALTSLLSFS